MKLGHSSGITLSVNGHRKSVFFTTRNPEEWERHIAFLQTEIRLGPGIKHVDWEKVGRTLCPETDWTKVRCTFVSASPNRPQCYFSSSLKGAWRSNGNRFWRCPHCRTLWASTDGNRWEEVHSD
jgi:hypothetical protein